MSAFKSGSHNFDIACTIKCEINSPLRHANNVLLDRLVELGTVDAVRRSKLLRHVELARVDVNRNDSTGTCHLGALNHRETNSSKPKDGDRRISGDLAGVPDRAESCRDATTEQACDIKWGFLGYLRTRDLGENRVSIGIVNDAKYNNNINEK